MKALILIAVLLVVGCLVAIWILYKQLNQTKRRIKALEDAQRESHEPGYWALSEGGELKGDYKFEGEAE